MDGLLDDLVWQNNTVLLFTMERLIWIIVVKCACPLQSFRRRVPCKERQSYRSIDYWAILCTKVCFSQWVYKEKYWKGREIRVLVLQEVFNCIFVFQFFKSGNWNGKSIRFKAYFFLYTDIVNRHYKLLNILSLICYDTGYYYCFCAKCEGCEEEYNVGSRLCPLCRIPIHFSSTEEFLDRNQFH